MRKWIIDDKRVEPYSSNPQKQTVSHKNGIILHYMIKTQTEYYLKRNRGSGIADDARYNNEFFQGLI